MTEMDDWLKKLGLEEYSSVLAKNDIDFDVLLELGERDLAETGAASIRPCPIGSTGIPTPG